jgi:hypothetical protein
MGDTLDSGKKGNIPCVDLRVRNLNGLSDGVSHSSRNEEGTGQDGGDLTTLDIVRVVGIKSTDSRRHMSIG